jgi:hypothetical protein
VYRLTSQLSQKQTAGPMRRKSRFEPTKGVVVLVQGPGIDPMN